MILNSFEQIPVFLWKNSLTCHSFGQRTKIPKNQMPFLKGFAVGWGGQVKVVIWYLFCFHKSVQVAYVEIAA